MPGKEFGKPGKEGQRKEFRLNLGNATTAVVLGGTSAKGALRYTGDTATYTRGFTVNACGGEVDVTTLGQTLTIATGTIGTEVDKMGLCEAVRQQRCGQGNSRDGLRKKLPPASLRKEHLLVPAFNRSRYGNHGLHFDERLFYNREINNSLWKINSFGRSE